MGNLSYTKSNSGHSETENYRFQLPDMILMRYPGIILHLIKYPRELVRRKLNQKIDLRANYIPRLGRKEVLERSDNSSLRHELFKTGNSSGFLLE
ncbi:hypothetical protein NPIL_469191 [Nephila pilipes]|uniref:Uncharacterized protein n=1 Tax=Nephila pilipes TaxID=299642 RepID=A0A8X6Q736_NEPPI|nr:hypothetical protein NPIL_469191 [Nephila pilipes]